MRYLTVTGLLTGYDGSPALSCPDFYVDSGDFLCIVGENGAGKSTLMKTLLGLLPSRGGEIRFENIKPNELGYLPQQTPVQKDFPASVEEIALSGCQGRMGLRPFYTKAEREKAEKCMARLGVTELRKRCYRGLSGGQQQRVLLARALVAAEKMIMLDEPVTGLDPETALSMYSLMAELSRGGMSVIMISHDVKASLEHATHVLRLGSKPFFGRAELFKEEV